MSQLNITLHVLVHSAYVNRSTNRAVLCVCARGGGGDMRRNDRRNRFDMKLVRPAVAAPETFKTKENQWTDSIADELQIWIP